MESVFVRPLALLRRHAGPFGLQSCYRQMADSLYYRTEVIQRPNGLRDWVRWYICAYHLLANVRYQSQFVVKMEQTGSFDWERNEQHVSVTSSIRKLYCIS